MHACTHRMHRANYLWDLRPSPSVVVEGRLIVEPVTECISIVLYLYFYS